MSGGSSYDSRLAAFRYAAGVTNTLMTSVVAVATVMLATNQVPSPQFFSFWGGRPRVESLYGTETMPPEAPSARPRPPVVIVDDQPRPKRKLNLDD